MEEVTISSKGQLVIPKYLRDALKLDAGTIVIVTLSGDKIMIMKKPDNPLTSLTREGAALGMKNIRRDIKTE